MAYKYWPYDELRFDLDAEKKAVSLATPWLRISRNFSDPHFKVVTHLAEKESKELLSAEDRPAIDWLFGQVAQFPLAYILPEPKAVDPKAFLFSQNGAPSNNPQDLVRQIITNSQESILSEAESQFSAKYSESTWAWDHEAALNFATAETGIHPESLLSVARRFHHLDVVENSQKQKSWERIQGSSDDDLRRLCPLVVRQNHYVTEQCFEALSPAKRIAGASAPAVASFINAEKGHDKILGAALKEMGVEPHEVPVSINTRLLMATLKYAASTNFLAFALLVDFFERSNYQEADPMAQLLEKAGYAKAAKYINRHMDINDMGEHENISFSFLEKLPLCPRDYSLEALKIAELGSQMITTVAESILQLEPEI